MPRACTRGDQWIGSTAEVDRVERELAEVVERARERRRARPSSEREPARVECPGYDDLVRAGRLRG